MTKKAIAKKSTLSSGLVNVGSLSPAEAAELFNGQKVDAQIVSLKETGEGIAGWFQGPGGGVDCTDQVTGEMRELPTWVFAIGEGLEMELVGSHQVDKRLMKTAPGTYITIVRGEQKRVGSKVVNQFLIAENPELSKVGK